MWTLSKPQSAKTFADDIDNLINHCRGLDQTHRLPLLALYKRYDHNAGYVTDKELLRLDEVKDVIKNQYTSKMGGDGSNLSYIRAELMSGVTACPMCGINEPNTLDHYMDKGRYGQLACFRLNLIPCCGCCNGKKHNIAYSDFVHAYYDRYPDEDFFKTVVTVKNKKVGLIFSIDKKIIGNDVLADKTQKQFEHLELDKRLHKAGIQFVHDIVDSIVCHDDRSLKESLAKLYESSKTSRKRNHWKTSVLKGLVNSKDFTMEVVNALKIKNRKQHDFGDGA